MDQEKLTPEQIAEQLDRRTFEMRALAIALSFPESAEMLINQCKPSNFQHPDCKEIFNAMIELKQSGAPVEQELLLGIKQKGLIIDEIMSKFKTSDTSETIKYYIRIITHQDLIEKIHDIGTEIADKISKPNADLGKIIEEATKDLEDLKDYTVSEIAQVENIDKPYGLDLLINEIQQTPEGLKTGYKCLDEIVAIPQEAITIIGARPSHGKTTFLLNLCLNMIDIYEDKIFVLFSYEETRKQIGLKFLNILSKALFTDKQNLIELENHLRFNKTGSAKVEEGKQKFNELTESNRLKIIDTPFYVDELITAIEYFKTNYDLGAVFIDYIQKIKIKERYGTRQIEIQKISQQLLETAQRLSIPIIMGAQLGRDKEHRDKVRLDNLREAGDIEQDANLVIGLYNPAMEKAQDEGNQLKDSKVDLEITILKNRNGPVNESRILEFNRPILFIEELEKNKKIIPID